MKDHWMRKPLIWGDVKRADDSRFMWLDHGYSQEPTTKAQCSLSLLGIINGLLPGGWLLMQYVPHTTRPDRTFWLNRILPKGWVLGKVPSGTTRAVPGHPDA